MNPLSILDMSDPNFHYGITATRNAQPFQNIAIHHTANKPLENLVNYGKTVDQQRGGAFGYHYYVGQDGSVVQGAPLDKRTNHIKPPSHGARAGRRVGASNSNTLGVTLVGGADGETPEQLAAAEALVRQLSSEHGIKIENVFGHGEVQSDRQETEGAALLARLRGGSGQQSLVGGTGDDRLREVEAIRAELSRREEIKAIQAELARREKESASAVSPETETGVLEAAGRGALQGATMGFSDEIYANQKPDTRARFAEALQQGMSVDEARAYANAPLMDSDLRDEIYDERLGEVRAANKQAQEDQSNAYLGGEITGAIGSSLIPGGAAANAVKGINTAGRALANAGAAGLQGAAYGFGTGEGGFEERRDSAFETGVISAAAGGAIPVFGKAISALGRSRATGKAAANLREIAPAVDDLEQAASNLFTQAEKSGVVVSQQTMENLSDKVWNRALKMGARVKLHPGAMAALEELRDQAAKGSVSMADLMGVRRVLQMGANDVMNKDNTRIVSAIVENFDNFMLNMKPKDFIKGGPSRQAVEEWQAARELWRRSIKAGVIEDAFERAANAKSGFENGLRDEFKAIINPARGGRANKVAKMFSDEEIDAMRKVVKGNFTTKTLRTLSKFGFGANNQNNFLGGTIGIGGGAALGGPVGAVAVPLLGQAAGKSAEKVTNRMGETVRAMVATGQSPQVPRLASSIAEKWMLQGAAALPAVQ